MSRPFTIGILLVLVALLGVMSFVVQPKKAAEPTPEQKAQEEQTAKEGQAKQQREYRDQMKMMMQARKKQARKKQAGKEKAALKAGAKPAGGQMSPPPGAASGAMNISGNWFKERASGEAGIADLQKAQTAPAPAPAPAPGPAHSEVGAPH